MRHVDSVFAVGKFEWAPCDHLAKYDECLQERRLLMDEPFGALDEFTRERLNVELMRIVGELKATTLFVTHNIQEAIYLADRVMVMTPRPGKIAEIIEVKFERPRDISIQTSREFNIIIEQVRDTLGSH